MAKSSSIPSCSSPYNLGYRLPAEWEKHEATWVTWPDKAHFVGHTMGTQLAKARKTFVQLVRALAPTEPVLINVPNAAAEREALKWLGTSHPETQFCHIVTDTLWCRDYAPSFVCRRSMEWRTPPLVAIDWGYASPVLANVKRPSTLRDNANDSAFSMFASRVLQVPCISGGMVLHGCDIETNGAGVLLTFDECLLSRNPDYQWAWIIARLRAMLGATEVCWLVDRSSETAKFAKPRVDCLARFVNEQTLVIPGASSDLHPSGHWNVRWLSASRDGKPMFEVVPLPVLPSGATVNYLDFYIGNEIVLMPAFGLPSDDIVRHRLAGFFPTRQILDIKCDLYGGGGRIHRLLRHVPAFDSSRK